jgi:hypothetical protein
MPSLRPAALALALAASGCIFIPIPAPPGAPGSITIIPGDPCGARSVAAFRGATEAEVRSVTFAAPGPVRILRAGEPVTREYIENRLTFLLGPDGRVADITCG